MKKLFLFAAVATMFAACSTDTTEDAAQIVVPDCLQVSIADEESRMQLSNEKTVWTAGDKVSVFYKSDANQCWKFNGKTGDRSGTLSCVSQGTATAKMEKVVIVYPYSESYMITPSSGNIEAKLPAVQKYMQGSYGLESSPMISSGYYTQFALKNVCGWLKLQLSGTGTITKITLKGNNDEQLAGDMYIDAADATVTLASASVDNDDNQETGGTLVFEDSIVKEVELDCDGGVDLSGADVTPFYIALPPTVFEQGFTATLHFDNGMQKEISTSKKVEITRNHIVPMEELAIDMSAYIVIKYVTSNKRIIDNSAKNSSWWASVVSNTYDTENNVGTLVIPKDSSIGNNAFQNVTGLLSIEIPDNMKGSVGSYAFDGCTALKSITMSKNTSSIDSYAFQNCENLVADMVIPNGQSTIEQYTFSGCKKLTSINISDGVTSIENYAFYRCSSLTSITIPDSVISIDGGFTFLGCSNLTSVHITDITKWYAIKFECSNSNPLDVAHNLYLNGELVTDLVIPDSVTSIEGYAFSGCNSLTSITIPDSVTTIGDSAFNNCSSLTSVHITDIAKWCAIKFDNNISNPLHYANLYLNGELITDLVIPNSVTSIGDFAFYGYNSLTSITIPDGVTSIGYAAFNGCSSLTSVTIPNSVTSIEGSAFYGCSSLTSVTIPDSVTWIGETAFSGCNSLTSINIPDGVTSIEMYAFSDCSSLTSITIPNSVTSIGKHAFRECSSLTSINIPDSVTSIGYAAFQRCGSLTSVTIPDRVTSIEDYVFGSCSSLTSVTIPDGVTSIGKYAFNNCSKLPSVTIPDSVTSIEESAFYRCSSLTSINIPDGVTLIKYAVFSGCSSLTSVTIPDSVTSIIGSAFNGCSNLTSIYCKPTIPPTLSSTFINIPSTAKIYVPTASVDAYKSANNWSSYASKIIGYDF